MTTAREPRLDFLPLELPLARAWTIARGTSTAKRNGLLVLEAEGVTGRGEAAPNARYQQSFDTAAEAFERLRGAVAGLSPWEHRRWLEAAEAAAPEEPELVCALDAALWDWKGRRLGRPVWQLLGTPSDRMPVTSFSIGLDEPAALAEKAREAAGFPILKVKMGLGDDEAVLRAIRDATDRTLRVDANEGWRDPNEAARKVAWLAAEGVELVEQPLPADDAEGARVLFANAKIPIVADESAMGAAAVPALAGRFHGVNVKLAKCGGLTRGLEALAVARALGLRVMLGCMIESSLGIAAALPLAPLCDWVDLDGNLLLARDPYVGLRVEGGRWRLPEGPGLGVEPRV